jgi:hypothetical protein
MTDKPPKTTRRTLPETFALAMRLKTLMISAARPVALGEISEALGVTAPEATRLLKQIGAQKHRYGAYIYTVTEEDRAFVDAVKPTKDD